MMSCFCCDSHLSDIFFKNSECQGTFEREREVRNGKRLSSVKHDPEVYLNLYLGS